MYIKYNENYHFQIENFRKSYVWLYLRDEINTLLASSIDQLKIINFDEAYVYSKNQIFENRLREFYTKKDYEQALCLTGLTGSGKSTLLNKVFRTCNNIPKVRNGSLIIPFNFDNFNANGDVEKVSKRMTDVVLAATDILVQDQKLTSVFDRNEEFVTFINSIHPDVFYFENKLCKTDSERIEQLYLEKRYEFAMLSLKFYLIDEKNKIENVILILDDIESIGNRLEPQSIITMFRMIECMHNIPERFKQKYNTNFICSCRHFIYRILVENRDSEEYRVMESYNEVETLDVSNHIYVSEIIEKRSNSILKKNNDEKKRVAFEIVKDIIKKLYDNSDNFIVHLNLNNIRKTMDTLKKLIYNYVWIQREQVEPILGAFSIDDYNQFNVYFPNILRALCCENDYVYSSNRSIVPNIISNTTHNQTMIYQLLLIRYFTSFKNEWLESFDLETLIRKIEHIFNDNINTVSGFNEAIFTLLKNRLLLRGSDASRSDVRDITIDNFNEINKVYISDLAKDLMHLITQNSILLQSFLDDVYLPVDMLEKYNSTQYLFDANKFELCCDALKMIIEQEKQLTNIASGCGTLDEYYACFTSKPISKLLYDGLNISIVQFFSDDKLKGDNYNFIKLKLDECNKLIETV